MNRIILASIGIMAVYFLVMGVVFPDALSFTEKRETAPFFVTSQEKKSISSNESFDFIIDTGITGGDSDMLILIIGFPDAKSFDGIKIKSSDFTQSPKFFEVGDEIKKGDVVAHIGSQGGSTGPHLHFEVRENNTAIDPIEIFGWQMGPPPEPDPGGHVEND